jgi:hypothetical protein
MRRTGDGEEVHVCRHGWNAELAAEVNEEFARAKFTSSRRVAVAPTEIDKEDLQCIAIALQRSKVEAASCEGNAPEPK